MQQIDNLKHVISIVILNQVLPAKIAPRRRADTRTTFILKVLRHGIQMQTFGEFIVVLTLTNIVILRQNHVR